MWYTLLNAVQGALLCRKTDDINSIYLNQWIYNVEWKLYFHETYWWYTWINKYTAHLEIWQTCSFFLVDNTQYLSLCINYCYNRSLIKCKIIIYTISREAAFEGFKIMLLFFRQCWIILNCNKKLVLKIIYSRSLIKNSRNAELGTCVKKIRNLQYS